MNARHFLGLFLLSTLSLANAAAQVPQATDPCAEGRRIAESRPCLAGAADCAAAQRWHQVFGPPGRGWAEPQPVGALTPDLEARLPDTKISLQKSEPLRAVLTRLASATRMDLLVDPRVQGDFRAEPGTLPLREAWRKVLGTAGLTARSEGGRIVVSKGARDGGLPTAGPGVPIGFSCPTE
jgi:hypothetical protein